MAFDYINDAFKKLELLDEELFNLSADNTQDLEDFMDSSDEENVVNVIDPEATTEEELEDSYVGKVILTCNVCHSHMFNNKEDINIAEDGNVNVEVECPYCRESEGYSIAGEVTEFVPAEEENPSEEEPVATETPAEETTDEPLTEAVGGMLAGGAAGNIVGGAVGKNIGKGTGAAVGAAIGGATGGPIGAGVGAAVGKTIGGVAGKSIGKGVGTVAGGAIGNKLQDNAKKEEVDEHSGDLDENLGGVVAGGLIGSAVAGPLGGIAGAAAGSAIQNKLKKEEIDEQPEDLDEKLGGAIAGGLLGTAVAGPAGGIAGAAVGSAIQNKLKNEEVDDENIPLRMSRATKRTMQEDFKEVSITTEDQHLEMSSDENGKVTVTTEPVVSEEHVDVIAPISDETESEILSNNSEVIEDPVDDEFDFEFDEMDEESMNELGESYLKRVYENVESFRMTDVSSTDSSLIVEGVIKFTSGNTKKTGFIFEAKDAHTDGRVRFTGSNKQLTESADAFSLTGRMTDKKLVVESLKYNYTVNGESVRGLVRRK